MLKIVTVGGFSKMSAHLVPFVKESLLFFLVRNYFLSHVLLCFYGWKMYDFCINTCILLCFDAFLYLLSVWNEPRFMNDK